MRLGGDMYEKHPDRFRQDRMSDRSPCDGGRGSYSEKGFARHP